MPVALLLPHRTVISVAGPEADTFLHGLLTTGTLDLEAGERRYGALLTPQGKVMVEMVTERRPDGFLLDVDADAAADLAKRLNLFRLRAKVSVTVREDLCVVAFDGPPDPRSSGMPGRRFLERSEAPAPGDLLPYHVMRIAAGLPEQGTDFSAGDVFPADINMDIVGGVDFRKGCFVGQEVVSRMKRRGTARRRTLVIDAPPDLAIPSPVKAGALEIGTVTSAAGGKALARMRIDRLAEAEASGEPLFVGASTATVHRPDWLAAEQAKLRGE